MQHELGHEYANLEKEYVRSLGTILMREINTGHEYQLCMNCGTSMQINLNFILTLTKIVELFLKLHLHKFHSRFRCVNSIL